MKNFTFILLFACVAQVAAQNLQRPVPESWNIATIEKVAPIELEKPNLAPLKVEDAVNDLDKSIPWRFGYDHFVDYGIDTAGKWHSLPNGDRIWRIKFISPNALTMNLIFDSYNIPIGGKVYIYSGDKSQILSVFTHQHNSPEEILGTWMVDGESIWIEYFEPKKVSGQGRLNIGNVIHGYRTLNAANPKALNDSGDCNVDVNCDITGTSAVANDIKNDVKKSVGMVVVGGSGNCTGALVNNTNNDGTPYFLTANHCLGGSVAGWAFRFNWASDASVADCATASPSVDNTFIQTASGGILRASNSESDMALIEITDVAFFAASPDVVWAGWDRSTTAIPTLNVGVHHPSGDIQKVCVDFEGGTRVTTSFNGNPTTEVWQIADWDLGVTEPGSSGSPLFNQNGLIIGDLSGGSAACSGTVDNGGFDIYGRFGVSWDFGTTNATQLKFWLDPVGTNPTTLQQFPTTQISSFDAAISVLNIPTDLCDATITPTLRITNAGSTTLTSATITHQLDTDTPVVINWTGNLVMDAFEDIPLTAIAVSGAGAHSFTASVANPNGNVDELPSNDANTQNFSIPDSFQVTTIRVIITPDRYGNETTWQLTDSTGALVGDGGPYMTTGTNATQPDEITDVPITILDECYTFIIRDSYGDGMCCAYGAGDYRLEDVAGNILINGNGDFGADASHLFRVTGAGTCTDPDVPSATSATPSTICQSADSTLTWTGSLNDATAWHVYTGSCGGTQIGTSTSNSLVVSPTVTTTYYIRGEGGCVDASTGLCDSVTVNVNPLDDASFSYTSTTYCTNQLNPNAFGFPSPGTFTSTPGLIITNPATGAIDLLASTAGAYTITFTTSGPCPNTNTFNITLSAPSFAFTALSDLCIDVGIQNNLGGGTPVGGVYSGPGVIDDGNGTTYDFNPAAAGVGTHTITYTVVGVCSGSANDNVVVFAVPTVSFAALADLCLDAGTQTGLTGGSPTGGVYSGLGVTDVGDGINYSFDPAAAGAGTHTITYSFTDGNSCTGSANDNAVVFGLPTVTFAALGDLCLDAGNQTNQTGGSPAGGLYSGPGVTDTGDGINYSFNPVAAGVGTHTITYNFTDGNGCSGSANDNVVVFGLPTVSFATLGDLCVDAGNQTGLTGGSPAGGVYSGPGVVDDGNGISYSFNPAFSGVGTHTITYNFTDGNGCSGSANDNVVVFAVPTVNFAALADLCLDAGIQTGLTGGSPTGGVYSGPGVTDVGDGINYSFDPAVAGAGTHTITYIFTDGNGCDGGANDNVVVFSLPTVTFAALGDLCLDAGNQTNQTGGSPTGGLYSGPGVTDTGDGINYSFNPVAAGVGTHTITYNFTDGNSCSGSANDTVEVFPLPTATFTAPTDLCLDAGVQTGLVGGTSLGGVYSGTGVTDDGNGMTYSFDPTAAGVGVHTLTYTLGIAGCTDAASDDVEVFALPVVTFTALTDLCIDAGVQTSLGGATPAGGLYSGSGVTDDGDGMTYSFDPAAAGVGLHVLTYTVSDSNGCTSSASDNVEVFVIPTVTYTAPADLCIDAGVQSGLGGGTPTLGVYSGTGVTYDANGITYSFDPAAAGVGVHTITYEFSDINGCLGRATDDVEVFALPTVTFTAPADLCIDAGVQTGLGGGTSPGGVYSGTGVTDDGNGMTYSFDPTAAGVGVHTLMYTLGIAGCTDAASDDVEVFALPVVTFTALTDLCIDAGVQTSLGGATLAGGIYSGSGVTDDGNGMTYSFDPATAGVGIHIMTYTFTDGNGCTSSASDNVEVFVIPTVTYTAPADLCVDAGVQAGLGGATPAGGVYSGTGVTDDANGMTYSFDPAAAGVGTHTITYEFSDINGCLGRATDDVEVFALPTVTFIAPADLCIDAGVQTGLGGGTSPGGVYSGTGVTDDGNGMTYSFDPAASGVGVHTLMYTLGIAGCTDATSDDVEVFALPVVTFTALTDLCIDAGVQSGLGGTTPTGGIYSGSGVTDDGDGMTYSFDPATAGVGIHIMTYTFTDGNGCTSSASDNVEVFVIPTVTYTAPADLCIDAGVQAGLGGATPAGGVYSGTGVTDDANGMTYSFDPAAAGVGTHTITYEFSDINGCLGRATDDVEVFALPTVTFIAPADLCITAGVQAGLSGGTPTGGVYSGAGVTDNGNGMTYSFDPAAAGAGTHTITYTFEDGNGCSSSASDDVEVFTTPVVAFTAPADVCVDAGVQTGLGGGLASGGVYSGPGVTDDGNGMTYNFDPVAAGVGIHSITYTLNDSGCIGTAMDTIEVFDLPVVAFTAPADICITEGVQAGLGGGTPTGGLYSGPGVTDDANGMTYSFDPTAAGIGPNTISYTFTNGNGCTNSASDDVEVLALPIVTFTAPADLCVNAGVQTGLSGGSPTGGVYSGTGVTDGGDGMTYSFDPAVTGVGTQSISYTAGAVGCTNTAADTVQVFGSSIVTFNAPADLCIDAGIQTGLGGALPTGGTYYGPGVSDDGNGMTYSFDPAVAGAGVQTLVYLVGNIGCLSTGNDTVEVFDAPTVIFVAPTPNICVLDVVVTGLGGGTPTGGIYSGIGVSDDGNGMTFSFDPTASAPVGGNIPVTYTYADTNGCSNDTTENIFVNDAMNCDACQATATFGAAGWGAVMPSIDNLVLIEADYDTALLGSFEACKLIVNPGATLRVNAGDYILVNTDITVSVTGSLLVEHTGSVVQVEDSAMVTNDGTINVNVTTPEVAPRDFILSGSPMTMEMRNGVYNNSFRVVKHLTAAFDPDPAVDAFYMPNVVANFVDVDFNDWMFHTGIINPGEGYFVYPQANLADGNSTYDLVYEQGTLNNGVITYAMEFNGDANSSPSMLANPYPSAIDASLFLNANPEIDEVYFWEHITEPGAFPGGNITTENFSMEDISMYNLSGGIGAGTPATNGSTTPNGMIATSQGFGVKANAMGTAIFNNAMRVTTGNNTLRNTVSEGNKIWLQLENAQYSLSSEVLIAFMPMATESYDSGYDSHQIGSLVSLYSHLPDNTMSLGIQGREVFNKEIQIPMGYASQIDETTTFKITIKQLEGVDIENATVYLIDKATRTITNLTKEGAYKFRSRKGNFPNRFTLQFMAYDRFGRILGDDAAAIAAISVVPNPTDGLLFINSPNSIINTITLTDMRGRLVRNLKNIDGLNSTIDISVLDSAVYFLKIETEKGTLVRKVMKE